MISSCAPRNSRTRRPASQIATGCAGCCRVFIHHLLTTRSMSFLSFTIGLAADEAIVPAGLSVCAVRQTMTETIPGSFAEPVGGGPERTFCGVQPTVPRLVQ